MSKPPDPCSGHCRTFSRKLDTIAGSFDTIVISRFPDSLRYHAEKLRIRQWSTEIVSQYTTGAGDTATFLLVVTQHTEPYKAMDGYSSNLVGQAAVKAKEIEDKRKIASGKQSYDKFLRSAGTLRQPDRYVLSKDYVDFAFTASSGCDWIVAGDEKVSAVTRVCFSPSAETLVELVRRRAEEKRTAREERRRAAEQERKKRKILASLGNDLADKDATAVESKPATAAGSRPVTKGDKGGSSVGSASRDVVAAEAAAINSSAEENPVTESKEEEEEEEDDDDDFFEYVMVPSEAPAAPAGGQYPLAGGSLHRPGVRTRRLKKGVFDISFVSSSCWLSQTVRLWPGEYYVSTSVEFSATTEELARAAKVFDVKDAPWLEHENFAREPKIWMQLSSNNGTFSLSRSDTYPDHGTVVGGLKGSENVWPFLAENQADVSTRCLVRMLSRLRSDNELLGAQALTASKRFLEVYKREENKFFEEIEGTRLSLIYSCSHICT